jgi:NADPH:quinone reductase-like Zn-dependent oxidoreductase
MPDPELRDEDVMVQVHAASVNPLDPEIRDGEFKFILPYPSPLFLGNDLAGVVVRIEVSCCRQRLRGRRRHRQLDMVVIQGGLEEIRHRLHN